MRVVLVLFERELAEGFGSTYTEAIEDAKSQLCNMDRAFWDDNPQVQVIEYYPED